MIITSLNKNQMEFEGVSLALIQTPNANYNESLINIDTVLCDEEKKYYMRLYRNKKRQMELYKGRLIAKTLIIEKLNLGLNMNKIKLIKENDKSKPHIVINDLKQDSDISISHNDFYIGAVYSKNLKVGLDIESKYYKLSKELIKYAFTQEEIDYWSCFEESLNIWTLLWTIKEAVGKAMGSGLSEGMDFVQIFMDNNKKFKIVFKNDSEIKNKFINIYCFIKDNNYISICSIGGEKF